MFLSKCNLQWSMLFRANNKLQCSNKWMISGSQWWRCTSNSASDVSILKSSNNDNISTVHQTSSDILSQSDVCQPLQLNLSAQDLTNVNTLITPIREAWVENMNTPHSIKLGIVQLHPQIFSIFPRPDMIQENHKWQTLYKHVDWRCMKTRAELSGANRKPWPQKGTGRARHGSRLSPQWKNGGWAHGPRGPKTYFYMLPWPKRVMGLISMLSIKFSQNDLHVVDTFESFPQDGTFEHLEELCETRGWGPSVLFVDKMSVEHAPQCTKAMHLQKASESINHINMLPSYGLNVFAMLKHETLVLTVDALQDIERKLLFHQRRIDLKNVIFKYKPDGVFRL